MDEYRQITRKGSPPYFARGLARLTRSPWRAVVSARLGGISTGALSNLLPTKSIGRQPVDASQHDPPAPASNAPSFSVVSSVADSVFGGGASRRARIAEVLNIICQGSARYRSSAPPDVSMVVTQPLAGTGSTSQASHPGRRASSERRAGPSKPLSRPGVPSHRVDKGASALA